jgi:hypothetical protein
MSGRNQWCGDLTSDSSNGGGGPTQLPYWYSAVDDMALGIGTISGDLANYSVGQQFYPFVQAGGSLSVKGIRSYIRLSGGAPAYPKTFRFKLWNAGTATAVASQDVVVAAEGIVIATFATPYVIPAAYLNSLPNQYLARMWVASMWETSGTDSACYTTGAAGMPPFPIPHFVSQCHAMVFQGAYVIGDGMPVNAGPNIKFYPVEPLFV